jgi:hypothetical protein
MQQALQPTKLHMLCDASQLLPPMLIVCSILLYFGGVSGSKAVALAEQCATNCLGGEAPTGVVQCRGSTPCVTCVTPGGECFWQYHRV